MRKTKENKAITLIALIITIITLLIIAGISIIFVTSENGLLAKAKLSKEETLNAQNQEEQSLSTTNEFMDRFINGRTGDISSTTRSSTIISNTSISVSNIGTTGFKCIITPTVENISSILDYHIYIVNKNNSNEYYAYTSTTQEITINNLGSEAIYLVYVVAFDLKGGASQSNTLEITTLSGPVIAIDNAYYMYAYNTPYSATPEMISGYLFDGNTNNGGGYRGVLFTSSSYIEVTITKNILLYGYSHLYNDGGGSSGVNIVFEKFNGTSYVAYNSFPTDTSGNKYLIGEISPGKYRVRPQYNYVTLDELVYELK